MLFSYIADSPGSESGGDAIRLSEGWCGETRCWGREGSGVSSGEMCCCACGGVELLSGMMFVGRWASF